MTAVALPLDTLDTPQQELLPDSRLARPTGVVWRGNAWWVPIFCANCGRDGGFVPEENCTFACYLCLDCSEKMGAIAHTYLEPDAVFWARVAAEQLEKYQRFLTPTELLAAMESDTPLGHLLRDRAKGLLHA